MTGHKHAQQIVDALLEPQMQRVCAGCEKEFGPVPTLPGHRKSHGYCQRHLKEYFPGMDDEIDQVPLERQLPDRAPQPPPAAAPAAAPVVPLNDLNAG